MRTFDFTPLYRSTVGFDRLFDMLDSSGRPDWPPYDIEKVSENEYRIIMAVAGFGPDEIELTQQSTELQVVGKKSTKQPEQQLLHRGIAGRDFRQTFNLADHVKVASAALDNGLLSINLVREVPEQMKPRRIQIGPASANGQSPQDIQPKQIERDGSATKAA